ncbi:MAG: hypothetical protein GPOALKHO_002015 [Sodalis sp.]|nr:MAG: hypothetical protein GPOALKHO_002015 [Sodalis sp.]
MILRFRFRPPQRGDSDKQLNKVVGVSIEKMKGVSVKMNQKLSIETDAMLPCTHYIVYSVFSKRHVVHCSLKGT